MKKQITYKNNKLTITFDLNKEIIRTLFIVKANGGDVAFENRSPNTIEDLSGNDISWKLCDQLVEIGLLYEDDEAHDVFFELTPDGEEVLQQISAQEKK